jgi:energy-coupling factor transporter ATP-binding protein EcfA2
MENIGEKKEESSDKENIDEEEGNIGEEVKKKENEKEKKEKDETEKELKTKIKNNLSLYKNDFDIAIKEKKYRWSYDKKIPKVFLIGHTGAGKSSLINSINNVLNDQDGKMVHTIKGNVTCTKQFKKYHFSNDYPFYIYDTIGMSYKTLLEEKEKIGYLFDGRWKEESFMNENNYYSKLFYDFQGHKPNLVVIVVDITNDYSSQFVLLIQSMASIKGIEVMTVFTRSEKKKTNLKNETIVEPTFYVTNSTDEFEIHHDQDKKITMLRMIYQISIFLKRKE